VDAHGAVSFSRSAAARPVSEPRTKHVPGEEGIWIFVLGDMTVFALLFGVFLSARAKDPALFDQGSATLNQSYGAVNTLLLLTSSLLVITGLRAVRGTLRAIAGRCFAGAMCCGAGFACLKVVEYHHELAHGLTPATNDFYMYFFLLTGLHFFHLLVGMSILAFLLVQARRSSPISRRRYAFMEGGACFWHMVDLLWIVLFPLLYLMK
jgi:nitric oxide reductase NorE protein